MKKKANLILPAGILSFLLLFPVSLPASNGHFLHGTGAVNDAMGGSGTAGNRDDIIGSIHRNPANSSLFGNKSFSMSFGLLFPDLSVDSSVEVLGLQGSSDSEIDIIPCANLGMVLKGENSKTAYHFLVVAEAGLSLDFEESTSNPVFMPQAGAAHNPFGGLFGGLGRLKCQYELVRVPLGFSYNANDKVQVGFSVAPSLARMRFTPAAFAAPDDANGDGIPTNPFVEDYEFAYGIGFQGGVKYRATDGLTLGLSLTSPTWFTKFEWDVKDETGATRKVSTRLNRPLSIGVGGSWQFRDDTLLLFDMHWYNYSDTEGFDESGFASDFSLAGLGWDDMWVFSLGLQHSLTNRYTLRAGYNHCSNPIDEELTFFNLASPLHVKHNLSAGVSYLVWEKTRIDLAYTRSLSHSQSGPLYNPAGPVPGTEVSSELEIDMISVSITFEL